MATSSRATLGESPDRTETPESRGLLLLLTIQIGPLALGQDKSQKKIGQEEREDYYQKWLKEDVFWIIAEAEKDVFKKLTNAEERDAFIEQFWYRRDPEPNSTFNEFKEEHYRRIAFANENFTAGIDGWKSDRGWIYIQFGPPDRKETYPTGGQYERRRKEGGGRTSIFPIEREYRNIEGLGQDIELEFIDDEGGGLYELTFEEQRKDAMLHVGFSSPTLDEWERLEESGVANKQDRVARRKSSGQWKGAYSGMGAFENVKDQPFQELALSGSLNRSLEVKYKDLESAVSTRITYRQLPFEVRSDYVRITDQQVSVLVTILVANQNMTFEPDGRGLNRAQIQIFGRVSNLGKRVLTLFEDDLARAYPAGRLEAAQNRSSIYQKRLLLRPGTYKLEIGIKDAHSDLIGTTEHRLAVPNYAQDKLALSSLVLASRIGPADGFESERAFVLGDLKVIPPTLDEFSSSDSLGLYFQIYNFGIDQQILKPDLKVEYSIVRAGSEPDMWRDASRSLLFAGQYCRLARLVNLSRLESGDYLLGIRVRDTIKNEVLTSLAPFRVVE